MNESVALSPEDFWKLLKLQGDLELATMRARILIESAMAAKSAFAKELAAKYPTFRAEDARYRADEATCALILDAPQ